MRCELYINVTLSTTKESYLSKELKNTPDSPIKPLSSDYLHYSKEDERLANQLISHATTRMR
jgi:hypothetical protein